MTGELITVDENELPAGTLWVPTRGPEVQALLNHLQIDDHGKEALVDEAATVLGKCVSPRGQPGTTTGLVLGYVQSGKTLSFTTVAALARDNGYPLIIVITGVATNLHDQSRGRLETDLRLQVNRKWRLFKNPKSDQARTVADLLLDWENPRLPDHRRQTVLITVLKNTTHLRNLVDLLGHLKLTNTPVLVIDDEADQAGLNTQVARGRQSTTYQRLVALRGRLPHHTYLQYTATPQAPLLINVIDTLSPEFVELLTPGEDYTGGDALFVQNPNLVRTIPSNEIPTNSQSLNEPPVSLLLALKLFFLGVAAGFIGGDDQRSKNRSMLVHPSRETPGHGQYEHWLTQIRFQWLELLSNRTEGHERKQLIDSFRPAYDDLHQTVASLPTFDELVNELEYSIRKVEIRQVNARPITPAIPWKDTYPWILVGGQAMERGFTVEGLTVTYMPRDMGVGNADTVQQRARFFGYKRSYVGFCRVFLEQELLGAFRAYVEHENDVRARLSQHGDRPLKEWRRAFFLESTQRPTRRQVLDLDYRQDTFSDRWSWPKVPYGTLGLLDSNRHTVKTFIATLAWQADVGDPRRTPDQVHLVSFEVLLRKAYEELLTPMRLPDEYDSQAFTGVLLQIEAHLRQYPNATCTIYQMSKGNSRLRSVDESGEIPTLFQGANYAGRGHTDQIYPGDDGVREANGLTIQIHTLEVRDVRKGPLIAADVPAIAVWVPAAMQRAWLVQER